MSGLNQQFAKLPYPIRVPGVRIPLSPQTFPRVNETKSSGCSAARLAHLLWEQRVPGSNPGTPTYAEIAQLVEHNLAKVGVASSSLVFRSHSFNGIANVAQW